MTQISLLFFILTSIKIFAQTSLPSDSIPLIINEQNTIFVKTIFNEKDTLNLNFDTGTTELILTNKTLQDKLTTTPNLYSTLYNLKIGNTNYKTNVYDAELSGHGTDGRFGWDLFKDKIVELNYDLNLMIIHSKLPEKLLRHRKFSRLKITFWKDLFLVESEIKQDRISNKDFYLFDTGYQRTVLLDDDLLKDSNFPVERMEVLKKVMLKGAQGNEIPVLTSNFIILPKFRTVS